MRVLKVCLMVSWITCFTWLTGVQFADDKMRTPAVPEVKSHPGRNNQQTTPQNLWTNWLIIGGNQYIPVVNEVGRNFQLARENFLQMDFTRSAQDIHKAAGFLQEELGNASREQKVKLEKSIHALNQLAYGLDHHSITSLDQLDTVIAYVNRADMEHSWIVVGVEKWTPLAKAPNSHLLQARQDFIHSDFKSAAAELFKVSGLLKLELNRATPDGKSRLTATWKVMDKLALQIQKGSINDVNELNAPFAQAQYAFAETHYLNALQDWNNHDSTQTGFELNAAILNLEEGAKWAGHGAEYNNSWFVKDAYALSQKLISGQLGVSANVPREIHSVGDTIENLLKQIEPRVS
jgi:hypothetical protein